MKNIKTLVAVMGCEAHAADGHHQAIRDTWGADSWKTGFGDLRIFVGWGVRPLEEDEIRVDAPDEKSGLTQKVAKLCEWALDIGYDMIFKVNTNTYCNIDLIAQENYAGFDYIGAPIGIPGQFYAGTPAYSFLQGSASWLSRRAAEIVAREAVDIANRKSVEWLKYTGHIAPYPHSEDLWVGQALTLHDEIRWLPDSRYSNGPLTFWSQSNIIKTKYLAQWMHAMHNRKNWPIDQAAALDQFRNMT